MNQTDRRTKRSDDPSMALSLYLASHARRSGARAATLSDEGGLLIAGGSLAGCDDLEVLAAEGSARTSGSTRGGGVFGDRLDVSGVAVVLSTLGAPSHDPGDAQRAASRILGMRHD